MPLVKRPTDNLEAYNLVLQGRHHTFRGTHAAFDKALACFTQALAIEPVYAQAQAGIARLHVMRAVLSVAAPHTVMPEAKEVALKALGLDETVAEAHELLAWVRHWYDWDWVGAEREYRRALELNPGDTQARTAYASLLGQVGRTDEGVTEALTAVEHDPLSAQPHFMLGQMFVVARRFEEAIAESRTGIGLDPSFPHSYMTLGLGLVGLGRPNEAVEAFRQQVTVAPDAPVPQAMLGWGVGLVGQRREALTILGDLERPRSKSYVGGSLLAWICAGLGDRDRALSWLQQAAEERDGLLAAHMSWLAIFDPLRSDPRFQALVKKMNFPAPPQS